MICQLRLGNNLQTYCILGFVASFILIPTIIIISAATTRRISFFEITYFIVNAVMLASIPTYVWLKRRLDTSQDHWDPTPLIALTGANLVGMFVGSFLAGVFYIALLCGLTFTWAG
jgi:hypothetical protein